MAAGAGAAERDAGGKVGARLSYSAGISACERGEQWQQALALLSEMSEVKLEPDAISYSAGVSACEKGEQWQRALALLSEMREAKLKPPYQLQCWDQRVREGRAVAAGAGAAERDGGGEAGARLSYNAGISACEKGEQWQRALVLLSEMWKAKLKRNVISYNAGISACEKGEQWQRAMALLSEMREAKPEPDVISPTSTMLGSARARSASSGGRRWHC
ncbi:unnamed protein product [Prorocentrum cordatum]|uniref:Pentacotripeptide-repeat region of PRORP domain-containing protein n=1 Tax=Prorocentrum cordatum TaxID=2364126 RepID=A0ABN9X2U3_9DINO|nr:unnamed protein product [Polarella glacialis]